MDGWKRGFTEQLLEIFERRPLVYEHTVEDYSIIFTHGSNFCTCYLASEVELGQGNLALPT